mgnify:CR=1
MIKIYKFISDIFKIKISHKFLKHLDLLILNLLGLNFLSFILEKVLKKNRLE